LLTAQPFDPADSPRELHHTQSPGKQQISLHQPLQGGDISRHPTLQKAPEEEIKATQLVGVHAQMS
jgi:hypothetical protein